MTGRSVARQDSRSARDRRPPWARKSSSMRAAIEPEEGLDAIARDRREGTREVGVPDLRPDRMGLSRGVEVERARDRAVRDAVDDLDAAHALGRDPVVPHEGRHRVAALGQRHRRRDHVGPGQPPEARMDRVVAAEHRRHGDGAVADVVDAPAQDEAEAVARLALEQVLPHAGARRGGRRAHEVVAGVDAVGRRVDLREAEAADPAHQVVDDALRERAGDRRVEGVAAPFQHVGADLHRLRLRGADHSLAHARPSPRIRRA